MDFIIRNFSISFLFCNNRQAINKGIAINKYSTKSFDNYLSSRKHSVKNSEPEPIRDNRIESDNQIDCNQTIRRRIVKNFVLEKQISHLFGLKIAKEVILHNRFDLLIMLLCTCVCVFEQKKRIVFDRLEKRKKEKPQNPNIN